MPAQRSPSGCRPAAADERGARSRPGARFRPAGRSHRRRRRSGAAREEAEVGDRRHGRDRAPALRSPALRGPPRRTAWAPPPRPPPRRGEAEEGQRHRRSASPPGGAPRSVAGAHGPADAGLRAAARATGRASRPRHHGGREEAGPEAPDGGGRFELGLEEEGAPGLDPALDHERERAEQAQDEEPPRERRCDAGPPGGERWGTPCSKPPQTSTSRAIPARMGSAPAPAPRASPTATAATRNPAEKSACATCMTRGPPEVSTLVAATLMTTSTAPDVSAHDHSASARKLPDRARQARQDDRGRPKRTRVSGRRSAVRRGRRSVR